MSQHIKIRISSLFQYMHLLHELHYKLGKDIWTQVALCECRRVLAGGLICWIVCNTLVSLPLTLLKMHLKAFSWRAVFPFPFVSAERKWGWTERRYWGPCWWRSSEASTFVTLNRCRGRGFVHNTCILFTVHDLCNNYKYTVYIYIVAIVIFAYLSLTWEQNFISLKLWLQE